MPSSLKSLRSKADRLFYLKLVKDKCESCGKSGVMQVHHVMPKGQYGHLRYCEENGVCICVGCHFAIHTKGNPLIIERIREKRGEEWWQDLKKKAQITERSYINKNYYLEVIKKYGSNN